MPWSIEDVEKHKKGLTDDEKAQWVAVANSVLKKCMDDGGTEESCAISAIKQANGVTEDAMPMPELETRNFEEIRTLNKRTVEGYAIVFNSESRDLGGFKEIILPEAIEGVIEQSDVLALVNHDINKGVLARSTNGRGSLKLIPDKKGVKYSLEAPKTALGDEVIEGINRGDIRTSSFSFSVGKEGQAWERRGKMAIRTITKFENIYDVSAVYREAYENTSVALRNLETLEKLELEQKLEPEAKPITEEPVTEPIAVRDEPKVKEPIEEQKDSINLKHNSMTITELKALKAEAREQNDKIFEAKKTEKRTLTDKEEAQIAENNQKMKEYDLEIESEMRKEGPASFVGGGGPYLHFGRPKEDFSLIKTIRAQLNKDPLPEAARDLTALGREQFRSADKTATGFVTIPNYEKAVVGGEKRAYPIQAQTAAHGEEIVAEDKKAILPPLVDRLVFSQAGVTYMPGLVGDVSIPTYAGTTVVWADENEESTDGGAAFSEVVFAPKRLTAYLDVSKTFLAQDSVGAERLLLDNIANAVARMLEKTILGPATLSSKKPSGIGYKLYATAKLTGATITHAAIVGLETAVDVSKALQGNLAYITNGTARGILKILDLGDTNDTGEFLMMDNQMNGYPVLVTNAIGADYGNNSGNLVCFGNWADLCIAQWGGYDITVDPYTLARWNQVEIVINAYFDAKGLRGSTGADATLDEYAKSFSALSIS
jgi:HK97 family phage major capsid protein/HK97 family phage prohead protease